MSMSHPMITASLAKTYFFFNFLIGYVYLHCKNIYGQISNSNMYTLVIGFITYAIIKAVKNTQKFIAYANEKIAYVRDNYKQDENIQKIIKKTVGISQTENFKKTVFIVNLCINFAKERLIQLYMRCRCGVRSVPHTRLFVGTMLYQNKLLRFPIKPNPYGTRKIIKIEYKVIDDSESPYISDAYSVEYIKSFVETKIDNITITPRLIGFDMIRLTILDEDFNEVTKDYSLHDKIE